MIFFVIFGIISLYRFEFVFIFFYFCCLPVVTTMSGYTTTIVSFFVGFRVNNSDDKVKFERIIDQIMFVSML